MTRCRILATLIALAVLLMVPAIARASDNDIPGTPITLGNAVVGTVDSTTDPNDVYAVTLTEGQEIEMTCTVHGNSTACRVSLLAPSSTSISDEKFYARVADESSGYYEDEPAHFYYTPAVSGVYFVWVTTTDGDGNAPYTLTVARTSTPAITTPDTGDIPGIGIGAGSVIGVVDSTTDPNDTYAVYLQDSQEASFTCAMHGNSTACRVSLLAPSSTSISDEKFYARVADESSGYYEDEPAHFYYTPAVSGVYFVWVTTTDGDGNAPYTLTLGGNAIRPSVYDSVAPTTSAKKVTVQRGAKAVLKFQVNDPEPTCGTANVVVKVRKGSTVLRSVSLNSKPTNQALTWSFRCTLLKGKYTYQVYATDLAGHVQKKAGKAKLVVKK